MFINWKIQNGKDGNSLKICINKIPIRTIACFGGGKTTTK